MYSIADAPTDGISSLAWLDRDTLVSANWDSSIRLFRASSSAAALEPRGAWRHHKAPVLCVAPGPTGAGAGAGASVLSGGVDGDVRLSHSLSGSAGSGGSGGGGSGGASDVIGAHTQAVRCVMWCGDASVRLAASGAWDGAVRLWDPQASSGGGARPAASFQLPSDAEHGQSKVFAMALLGGGAGASESAPRLVVGTSWRQILTFDLRKLGAGPLTTVDSPLKHQTRSIEASPAGDFLAIGCTEGRVAIEYTAAESASKSYAFKCHRRKEPANAGAAPGAEAAETSFPVHAIAFHPVHGTFATGGGDKQVALWDGAGRKRLALVGPFPNTVTALAFSTGDGGRLAIASSYDYVAGEGVTHPPDSIFVSTVADGEVRPKGAK